MKTYITFFLMGFMFASHAQAVERALISPLGGAISEGPIHFHQSLGELAIFTNTNELFRIHEGMVQGNIEIRSRSASPEYATSMISPDIRLFPNPTADFLHVDLPENQEVAFDWRLVEMSGKMIRSEKNVLQQAQIPMQDLRPGTYLLHLSSVSFTPQSYTVIKH